MSISEPRGAGISDSRPCKERKDGALTVLLMPARSRARAARLSTQSDRCFFLLDAEHHEGRRISSMLIEYSETQMPGCRNQPLLCFGILKLLMSLCLVLPEVSLSAQTLEIALVDGRNGRAMVGSSSYVNVWVGTGRKEAIVIPSDGKGVARLRLTLNASEVNIPNSQNNGSIVVDHPILKYEESFRINAPYVLCVSGGSNYSWLGLENFSTKEILHHGYVSPNTCGKVTVSPQPGQVVLFVRPLTWWEKLKQ
jgi:hypothetical protein